MSRSFAPRPCIFCGRAGLTNEHIWSNWLTNSGLVPPQRDHHRLKTTKTIDPSTRTLYLQVGFGEQVPKPLIQKTVKRVCKTCNNGWMGDIVGLAKPIVERLLSGSDGPISKSEQERLAAWVSLCCIMAEYTSPHEMGIPEADRKFLYEHHVPPSDWHIFVGEYLGVDWTPTRYVHHGPSNQPIISSIVGKEVMSPNFQVTTYTIGRLVFHAMSAEDPVISDVFGLRALPPKLARVWPSEDHTTWPTPLVDDEDMNVISDAFETLLLTGFAALSAEN